MWRLVKINSFWFRDWPSLSSSNFNLQFAKDLQSGFNVRFNFLVSGPRQALSPPSSIFILQCNCSHVLIDPLCSTKTLKRAIFCWVASHILRCWVGSWLPVLHECKIFLYFSREVATKFLIVWVDDFSHPCLADINWVVDEEKKNTPRLKFDVSLTPKLHFCLVSLLCLQRNCLIVLCSTRKQCVFPDVRTRRKPREDSGSLLVGTEIIA